MNLAKKTLSGTLPASWYSTKGIYELERRAIFGRQWMLITHECRFMNPGAYAKYTTAGYPFFIIRDRDGCLNAFLNVCRHRAFPVVLHDDGIAKNVLSCKYHGWSYSLKGNLAKAPKFAKVDEFNKTQYSLFKVHLKVDQMGFVWVNLDSAPEPEVPWEDAFSSPTEGVKVRALDVQNYQYSHSWSMRGDFNWKCLIDNYNECYHCPVAHPCLAKMTNLNGYDVKFGKRFIQHYADALSDHDDNLTLGPLFLLPNSAITVGFQYFYLMRVVPVTETQVSMEYEVYRHRDCDDETFEGNDEFFNQVENEDKFLCNKAQTNLSSGGYVTGPLHPHNEKGVLYITDFIKGLLFEHREKERKLGRNITPVRRDPGNPDVSEEELLCRAVCTHQNEQTVW